MSFLYGTLHRFLNKLTTVLCVCPPIDDKLRHNIVIGTDEWFHCKRCQKKNVKCMFIVVMHLATPS